MIGVKRGRDYNELSQSSDTKRHSKQADDLRDARVARSDIGLRICVSQWRRAVSFGSTRDVLSSGHRTIALMKRDFRTFKHWGPRSWQYDMFDLYLGGILQYAFWKQWSLHQDEILRHYGESNRPKIIMLTAPRREGKTVFATLFFALVIVYCTDYMNDILVMAQTNAQAKSFGQKICQWVYVLQKRAGCQIVAKEHKTSIEYYRPRFRNQGRRQHASYYETVITVQTCSSNGLGQRGFTPGLLVCDEALFADDRFIREQILPMLREVNVVLFGLSSMSSRAQNLKAFGISDAGDKESAKRAAKESKDASEALKGLLASNFDNMDDDERSRVMFRISAIIKDQQRESQNRVLHVRNWCHSCLEEFGLRSGAIPSRGACKHNILRVDPNMDDLMFIMRQMRDVDCSGQNGGSMARELANLPDVEDNVSFDPQLVETLRHTQPSAIPPNSCQDVMLFVDPTTGTRSHVACVGVVRNRVTNEYTVVVMGCYRVQYDTLINATTQQLVAQVAKLLKQDLRFRHSTLFVFVENNAGRSWVRFIVDAMLRENDCIVRMQQFSSGTGKPGGFLHGRANNPLSTFQNEPVLDGVGTTQTNKHLGVNYMACLLQNRQLRVARDFIQVSDHGLEDGNVSLVESLIDQLKKLRKEMRSNGVPSHSGKHGPNSNDDLAICIIMVIYWTMMLDAQRDSMGDIGSIKTGQFIMSV